MTGNLASPEETELWELFAAELADAATPADRVRLETRLAADPRLRTQLDVARAIWSAAPGHPPVTHEDIQRAWSRLTAAVAADEALPLAPTVGRARPFVRDVPASPPAYRLALAASVILAVGLGVTWLVPRLSAPSEVAAVETREIVAPPGQRVVLRLGDGSQVWLAPGSRLRGPERFGAGARELSLYGQAYFEVTPDPARPFLVRSGGTLTRVIGTRFDVRAFPGDGPAVVVVREGRVSVRSEQGSEGVARELGRGDRAVVDSTGSIRVDRGIDVDALVAWTTGRLVFPDTPLREMAADLERWFEVDIEFADPAIGDRRLSATFEEESIETVLQIISELADVHVRRTGRLVVLSGKS